MITWTCKEISIINSKLLATVSYFKTSHHMTWKCLRWHGTQSVTGLRLSASRCRRGIAGMSGVKGGAVGVRGLWKTRGVEVCGKHEVRRFLKGCVPHPGLAYSTNPQRLRWSETLDLVESGSTFLTIQRCRAMEMFVWDDHTCSISECHLSFLSPFRAKSSQTNMEISAVVKTNRNISLWCLGCLEDISRRRQDCNVMRLWFHFKKRRFFHQVVV